MTTPNMGLPLPADGEQAWGAAVRSAFNTIDGEVGVIGDLIQALTDLTEIMGGPARVLPYAKDSNDRMRVVVAGTVDSTNINYGNYNAWPNYYGQGGPMAMDARDTERAMSNGRAHDLHNSWVIT